MIENTKCLKCGHGIDTHKIKIIGNWDFQEITCLTESEEDTSTICGCDAGFNKVQIKKEFSTMQK